MSRIAARFAPDADTHSNDSLCGICVDVLHVFGAGISIMSGTNSGPVCSSSESVRRLEDLQFSLGEGPCHDAYITSMMVSEPDLANRTTLDWPNYTLPALELGACAVFAFPLMVGVGTIGVLTVYQDNIGSLTDEQVADGHEISRMVPSVMAAIQARSPDPILVEELSDAGAHRVEVHQASGMVAVQLGVAVPDALARIRAHAYATNTTVADVAQRILARRLRLSEDEPRPPGASP